MSHGADLTFHSMGSDIRLIVGPSLLASDPSPATVAAQARDYVERFAARLSRFAPGSELCALNADPRPVVAASPLMRAAVRAGIWAAERSGGLVEPTLVRPLERAGYVHSMDGTAPAALAEALAHAPARRAASPDPASRWREIVVDDGAGVIARPPGVRIDTGGTGKGLCADAVAHRLARCTRFVVDCGGDMAIGGVDAQLHPYEIEVEHPISGESVRTLRIAAGGVATSGCNIRIWRTADGFAHHLLDPSTGRPAWTGLIGATALGPSALEAETLSKMALLLGPAGAREVLAAHGGVIVHDDGDVEEIGPLDGVAGPLLLAGSTP